MYNKRKGEIMKFWRAQLKNGQWVNENEQKWDDIKNEVSYLELHNNGQCISLPKNADSYIQGKTASANMATGEICIESRFFGYVMRNNVVKIRICELTNNITIENNI